MTVAYEKEIINKFPVYLFVGLFICILIHSLNLLLTSLHITYELLETLILHRFCQDFYHFMLFTLRNTDLQYRMNLPPRNSRNVRQYGNVRSKILTERDDGRNDDGDPER